MLTSEEFQNRFPRTAAVIQAGIDRSLHYGAQIYVSQAGRMLADVGVGQVAPHRELTADHVLPWLSAGKPLTAVLIARLQEAGQLDWDDPVIKFIPEFGRGGKDEITLRHLLTHTAGLSQTVTGWPDVDWQDSLRRICNAELPADWVVGETAGYDPQAGWFVLGEVIQRVTTQSFSTVLRENVLSPCGMGHSWASVEEEMSGLTDHCGWMWERKQGSLVRCEWNDETRLRRPAPGSSLRGPIRELGRFYEKLLHIGWHDSPSDRTMISRETVRMLTSRQRVGLMDRTFGHPVDWGLGFIINSSQYGIDRVTYGYGQFASSATFGHGGAQCSQGYCDPEQQLVVAYVFNGRPGEPQHQRRARQFNDAIYQDLGLV